MDPKIIVIAAGVFVAVIGYVCLAPDQFAVLRLPTAFAALGVVRIVTGLALMLLGVMGALSEVWGDPPRRRRRPTFAFADALLSERAEAPPAEDESPGPLVLTPERTVEPAVPNPDTLAEPGRPASAIEAPPEP